MRALICLPTYNEEKSIRPLAEKILQMGYDLVVTDAGSTDQTVSFARSMNRKKGKGEGLRHPPGFGLCP
jgi:glycosyltransferase involved in cell wall biosynthesis